MKKDERIICRCEEITQAEIMEAIRSGRTTLNEIKRFTRAGMGLCQGRTCRDLVASILSRETKQPPAQLPPSTFRPPVRPVSVGVLARRSKDGNLKEKKE